MRIEFFDAHDEHRYVVDGRETRSATQWLEAIGAYGEDAGFWSEHSRRLGTAVHKAAALYLTGMTDPADPDDRGNIERISDRLWLYVESLKLWMVRTHFRPVLIEHPIAYGTLYAGRIDAWGTGRTNGATENWLPDFKAGLKNPAYALQTAMYAKGLEFTDSKKTDRRMSVHLQRDGSPARTCWHENPSDFPTVMSGIAWHQWKEENKVA